MTQWEYLRVTLVDNSVKGLTQQMNNLGVEGWELEHYNQLPADIHAYYNAERVFLVFKRPVKKQEIL
jgi:hypothetical protein